MRGEEEEKRGGEKKRMRRLISSSPYLIFSSPLHRRDERCRMVALAGQRQREGGDFGGIRRRKPAANGVGGRGGQQAFSRAEQADLRRKIGLNFNRNRAKKRLQRQRRAVFEQGKLPGQVG